MVYCTHVQQTIFLLKKLKISTLSAADCVAAEKALDAAPLLPEEELSSSFAKSFSVLSDAVNARTNDETSDRSPLASNHWK